MARPRPSPLLAIATLLALVLAGCTGSSPNANPPSSSTPPSQTEGPAETGGSLVGLVVDDEEQPLADALVGMTKFDLEARTGKDGSFRFDKLPVGKHAVYATRVGYVNGAKSVEISEGETAEIKFVLQPIPTEEPYNVTSTYRGRVSCGVAATSPCAVTTFAFETAGQSDPLENDQGPSWNYKGLELPDAVVIEVQWTSTSGATGAKLAYSFATFSDDGLDRHEIAGGNKASPIHVVANQTDLEAALEEYASDFGWIMYPDEEGVTFLQDFVMYRTDFWNGPAPEGFTYVPPEA